MTRSNSGLLVLLSGLAASGCLGGVGACPEGTREEGTVCVHTASAADDAGDADGFDDGSAPLDGSNGSDEPSDAGIGAAPCTRTADPDPIDDDGRDTNCDGVDGVRENLLFVTTTGDDEAAGSEVFPLRTLKRALTRAAAEHKDVLVAQGTYDECDFALELGVVRVFGGYAEDSWTTRDLEAATVVRVSSQGMRIAGLHEPSRIERLHIEAASADDPEFCPSASPEVAAGRSSTALELSSATLGVTAEVVLRKSVLTAGTGGDGAAGAAGANGTSGTKGTDGCPGRSGCPALSERQVYGLTLAPPRTDCDFSALPIGGHGGGSEGNGSRGAGQLTAGGLAGSGRGEDGRAGTDGIHGVGGSEIGSFTEGYEPTFAEDGKTGTPGEGGGGGGGARRATASPRCPEIASSRSHRVPFSPPAPSGGSGGTGGCGGQGGEGAQGGGASVGVSMRDVRLVLEDAEIQAGAGGRGGRGGKGGAGGVGAAGGVGGIETCGVWNNQTYRAVPGGAGGQGASGGAGGYGGGGAGGPSIGAVVFGRSELVAEEDAVRAGQGGLGGASGGMPGTPGPSQRDFVTW